MSPTSPRQPDAEREARLASVLDRLVELAHRRAFGEFETVLREHPDLAAELQELWPAVQIAEEVAQTNALDAPEISASLSDSPAEASLPLRIGDYELLEEIGRGGMGVVYRARQRSLGRIVALKMLLDSPAISTEDLQRFRSEAKAAARLDHPNIVPVYETGEYQDRPYFSMKLIEGPTLAQLALAGPLPVRQAVRYVQKVAEAVHHAHQHGILHRDLKPSNVIVDKQDQPYVTDFGLAKRVPATAIESVPETSAWFSSEGQQSAWRSSLTGPGAIVGTPSYMPPEQAAAGRGQLSPASDVYSLGALLYFLLTSRPPFQASNPVDVLLQVLERDPVSPRLLNPNVDADLEAICLKALQKQPRMRYATAAELAADLRAYLDGRPVTVRSRTLKDIAMRLVFPSGLTASVGLPLSVWLTCGLVVLAVGGVSAGMLRLGITSRWPFFGLAMTALLTATGIVAGLLRRCGPLPAAGWQTLHLWLTGALAGASVFVIEWLLGLPMFRLLPVLAVFAAMLFLIHAGSISPRFYPVAGSCLVAPLLLPWLEEPAAVLLLAVLVGFGFLLPVLFRKTTRSVS